MSLEVPEVPRRAARTGDLLQLGCHLVNSRLSPCCWPCVVPPSPPWWTESTPLDRRPPRGPGAWLSHDRRYSSDVSWARAGVPMISMEVTAAPCHPHPLQPSGRSPIC